MNQQEIDRLWLKYADGADEGIPNACMTGTDFTQAAAEIRRQALEEAASLAEYYVQATRAAESIRALAQSEQERS